jgi:hypothetical protein
VAKGFFNGLFTQDCEWFSRIDGQLAAVAFAFVFHGRIHLKKYGFTCCMICSNPAKVKNALNVFLKDNFDEDCQCTSEYVSVCHHTNLGSPIVQT